MPVYNYSSVHIGSLANLRASLHITDSIICHLYDSKGAVSRKYRKNGIYNLVINQDVLYGEPRVNLAVYEAGPAGAPLFTLSYGTFLNKVRGLYYDNPDLDNTWAIDKWEEEEVLLPWGLRATTQSAVPKQFPVSVFDNLEYCELLILFNGGYAVIKKGRDMPDEATRKKIARLHDALTLLTGC
ncbi:MAG: hypothetical protein BWY80_01379 [Firmicutes bacterium ADurb.Bin456]|nr:MAG: hypothetical protein BWY80_01379 [Firmicutes bacterium ADurb.Bin456]